MSVSLTLSAGNTVRLSTYLSMIDVANAMLISPSGAASNGSVMYELKYLMNNSYGALEGLITFVNNGISGSGDGLTLATAKKTIAEASAMYLNGQQGIINVFTNSGYAENIVVPPNVELRGMNGFPEIFGDPVLTSAPNIITKPQSTLTNIRFKGQQTAVHVPCVVQLSDNVIIRGCSSDPQHAMFDSLFDFSFVGLGVTIEDCYFGGTDGLGSITTAFSNFSDLTTCLFQRNLWNGWIGDIIVGSPFYSTFYQDRFIGVTSGHYALNIDANAGLCIHECVSTGPGSLYIEQANPGSNPNSIINNNQWSSIPSQQYFRDAFAGFSAQVPIVSGSIDYNLNSIGSTIINLSSSDFNSLQKSSLNSSTSALALQTTLLSVSANIINLSGSDFNALQKTTLNNAIPAVQPVVLSASQPYYTPALQTTLLSVSGNINSLSTSDFNTLQKNTLNNLDISASSLPVVLSATQPYYPVSTFNPLISGVNVTEVAGQIVNGLQTLPLGADNKPLISDDISNINIISQAISGTPFDGMTFDYIMQLMLAMVNGNFSFDKTSKVLTFFKRDNTTVLTTVQMPDNNTRNRLT